jgi:hypothetical protein
MQQTIFICINHHFCSTIPHKVNGFTKSNHGFSKIQYIKAYCFCAMTNWLCHNVRNQVLLSCYWLLRAKAQSKIARFHSFQEPYQFMQHYCRIHVLKKTLISLSGFNSYLYCRGNNQERIGDISGRITFLWQFLSEMQKTLHSCYARPGE